MAKASGEAGKVIALLTTGGTNPNITGASGTSTITVVTAGHNIPNKSRILIEDVVGMTDINGEHTATSVSGTDVVFTLSPATAQSWSSGGTVQLITSITAWSLDIAGEVGDITDSSVATWKAFLASGFKGATGTFDVFLETATNDIVLGTSCELILRIDTSNYYTATAYVTDNTTTVDVPGSEAVKKTYSFTQTGSGVLTVA